MKSDIKPLPSEAILCGIRYTIQAHEGIVIHEHGCFRRLSGDGPFKCELEPLGQIPNNRKSSEPHKKFWPSPDDRTMLDVNQISGVRNLKRLKLPVTFYFDDNGNRI